MANNYTCIPYSEAYATKWDRFVREQSANGTFLQTRNFLNYHPDGRFVDSSIIFLKGDEIIAVIPNFLLVILGIKNLFIHSENYYFPH